MFGYGTDRSRRLFIEYPDPLVPKYIMLVPRDLRPHRLKIPKTSWYCHIKNGN